MRRRRGSGHLIAVCLVSGALAVGKVRTTILLDFADDSEIRLFQPIDDVVMGGVSGSRLEVDSPGVARFTGRVSLANNGGFASVRSAARDWHLERAKALSLRVRGDGRTYKFTVRVDDGFDGLQYQARFTPASDWSVIRLPLAAFVASYRGRRIIAAPPLEPAQIRTIGLMISDKQAGEFELSIDWIAAEFD